MHNAPSVSFPVGRSRVHAQLVFLLGLGGLSGLSAWWLLPSGLGDMHGWLAGWGALLWLCWAAAAVRVWWRAPRGLLCWDAQARAAWNEGPAGLWLWRSAAQAFPVRELQRVDVMLDLQSTALLRLNGGPAGVAWIWVECRQAPSLWVPLRRALSRHS
ncbi:hypothetical protein [Hydrogenophaga sp.]|uniref:hypothetical protein n=1 Tax=Hydrogenophaga sp. TaxID=1904254 RepID=UPI002634A75E|nr:hypothetical protein [Hydrogenophaga sp.]MCW5653266.1 hypothetical protein [Hydrogenophaga sp.]